ncbi:MAG: hypothetical protein ACK5LJ_00060 [Paracoccus sp. (in: a-proteobacteria)]
MKASLFQSSAIAQAIAAVSLPGVALAARAGLPAEQAQANGKGAATDDEDDSADSGGYGDYDDSTVEEEGESGEEGGEDYQSPAAEQSPANLLRRPCA